MRRGRRMMRGMRRRMRRGIRRGGGGEMRRRGRMMGWRWMRGMMRMLWSMIWGVEERVVACWEEFEGGW